MGQPVQAISPKVFFCGCCGEDGINPIAAIHEMDLEIYLLFCGGPGGLSGFQCVDVTVYAHSVAPIAASNRSPAPHASNVKVRSLGSEDAHQTNVCWHNKTSIFEDLGWSWYTVLLPLGRRKHSKILQITNNKSTLHRDYHGNLEATLEAALGPRLRDTFLTACACCVEMYWLCVCEPPFGETQSSETCWVDAWKSVVPSVLWRPDAPAEIPTWKCGMKLIQMNLKKM